MKLLLKYNTSGWTDLGRMNLVLQLIWMQTCLWCFVLFFSGSGIPDQELWTNSLPITDWAPPTPKLCHASGEWCTNLTLKEPKDNPCTFLDIIFVPLWEKYSLWFESIPSCVISKVWMKRRTNTGVLELHLCSVKGFPGEIWVWDGFSTWARNRGVRQKRAMSGASEVMGL